MNHETFPDKKEWSISFEEATRQVQDMTDFRERMEVGQENATWLPHGEYPQLPIMFVWMTDIHWGHVGTDHQRLLNHLKIVEDTPNTFVLFGGDLIDNFSAVKHPHAATGDVFPPQVQAEAMMAKITELDRQSKVGALCYGNHEDWMQYAGMDFYQTFMRELSAPVFHKGGMLNVNLEGQNYRIGVTRKHWGTSKITPENSGHRALLYTYPGADIVLLGDDHQAAGSVFSQGGERKIVVDGGTYKLNDSFGQKVGLGKAGAPGYTIMLSPGGKRMELYDNPETAQRDMLNMIFRVEHGE